MARRTMNRGSFSLKTSMAAVALSAAALACAPQDALAGIAPDTYMSVEIRNTSQVTLFDSGEVNLQSSGSGNMIAGWTYLNPQSNYPALDSSLYNSSGFILSRTQSGLLPATLFHNMTYENKSNETLEFIINVRMPLTQVANGPVIWEADSAWNLGGPNDPAVFTLDGMSLFTAYINGNQVGSQADDPSGFGGGGGQLQFDPPPVSGGFFSPVNELSMQLAFSLTPGANVGIQGVVEIPTPAAASLLALGVFGVSRRRRR